jgi:hypothetical protein
MFYMYKRGMAEPAFSTISVAPHPATYIPQPLGKKKGYQHASQRDLTVQIPNMKDFPILSKTPVTFVTTPLNFLTKLKGEDKSEQESQDIASMTLKELIKDGWSSTRTKESFVKNPSLHSPIYTKETCFPFPPEMSRRRIISKKPSYVDLYDMDFEDDLGAQVPILNESFNEDESIV